MSTKQQQKLDTNNRIIDAAKEEFIEKGFTGVRMSAVAARAGVSPGLINMRFETRDHVLLGVVRQLTQNRLETLYAPESFEALVLAAIRMCKSIAASSEMDFRFFRLLLTSRDVPELVMDYLREVFNRSGYEEIIKKAQAENPSVLSGDAFDVIKTYLTGIFSFLSWYIESGVPMPEDHTLLNTLNISPAETITADNTVKSADEREIFKSAVMACSDGRMVIDLTADRILKSSGILMPNTQNSEIRPYSRFRNWVSKYVVSSNFDRFDSVTTREKLMESYDSGEYIKSINFWAFLGDEKEKFYNATFWLSENSSGHKLAICVICDVNKVRYTGVEADKNHDIRSMPAEEYDTVLSADLQTEEVVIYAADDEFQRNVEGIGKGLVHFTGLCKKFIASSVYSADVAEMTKALTVSNIKDKLRRMSGYTKIFRNTEGKYCKLQCVKTSKGEGSFDVLIGIGIRDSELRTTVNEFAALSMPSTGGEPGRGLYRDAFLTDCAGFFEADLTNDVVMSSALPKWADRKNGGIIAGRSYSGTISYINDNFISSASEELLRVSSPENLIASYDRGEKRCSVNYWAMAENGERCYRREYMLGKDEATGRYFAFCTIRDITEEQQKVSRIEQNRRITDVLSDRYDAVFYINADEGTITTYTLPERFRKEFPGMLGSTMRYSGALKRFTDADILPSEKAGIMHALALENVVDALKNKTNYSVTYINNNGKFCELRFAVSGEDRSVIILGIVNKDEEIRRRNSDVSDLRRNSALIESLTQDYDAIMYVNAVTAEYTPFFVSGELRQRLVMSEGSGFYEMMRDNVMQNVFEDDRYRTLDSLNRKNIVAMLEKQNVFDFDYRVVENDDVLYYHIKFARTNDVDGEMCFVMGIRNDDARMRRELKFMSQIESAKAMAVRDSLTGIRNRTGYNSYEQMLQEKIDAGNAEGFAIVVCDINDLKKTNDSRGHEQGDRLIVNASRLICDIFKHSPVFRIGGDEFAAVLIGADYSKRHSLMKQLTYLIEVTEGVSLACGMSEYNNETDVKVADVFNRADSFMYSNKQRTKGDAR